MQKTLKNRRFRRVFVSLPRHFPRRIRPYAGGKSPKKGRQKFFARCAAKNFWIYTVPYSCPVPAGGAPFPRQERGAGHAFALALPAIVNSRCRPQPTFRSYAAQLLLISSRPRPRFGDFLCVRVGVPRLKPCGLRLRRACPRPRRLACFCGLSGSLARSACSPPRSRGGRFASPAIVRRLSRSAGFLLPLRCMTS